MVDDPMPSVFARPVPSHDDYSRVEVSFSAFAPKYTESPAILRISYGHDQLSIRPTVVTRNASSELNGLRNLNSHLGNTVSSPPAKSRRAKTQVRGTRYEIRDDTVLTRTWLISGTSQGSAHQSCKFCKLPKGGQKSYSEIAEELFALGHANSNGVAFSKSSIKSMLEG